MILYYVTVNLGVEKNAPPPKIAELAERYGMKYDPDDDAWITYNAEGKKFGPALYPHDYVSEHEDKAFAFERECRLQGFKVESVKREVKYGPSLALQPAGGKQ